MFYKNVILIFIVGFLFHESSAKSKSDCKHLLGRVADTQSKLVSCMVEKSSPAESCVNCTISYNHTTHAYNQLVSNANCTKEMINQNRLRMVYTMQTFLEELWSKAFCDDCFTIIVNGTTEYEQFNKFITNFTNCIIANNKTKDTIDEICRACNLKYNDLNTFYKQMDETKKGKICFDIQDIMNRTRSYWSKDLNCCHREYSLMLFIIASSLFGALTLAFYFGMYSYTKRMERNHEILYADLNTEQASTSTGVISGTLSNNEIQSTKEANEESIDDLKKYKKTQNASSSNSQSISKGNVSDSENIETLKIAQEEPRTERQNSSNANNPLIDL